MPKRHSTSEKSRAFPERTAGRRNDILSGCSLKCIFCQNMPISRDGYGKEITPERLGEIMLELQEKVRITSTL